MLHSAPVSTAWNLDWVMKYTCLLEHSTLLNAIEGRVFSWKHTAPNLTGGWCITMVQGEHTTSSAC